MMLKKRIFYGRYIMPLNDRDLLVFVEENAVAHFDSKTINFISLEKAKNHL
jgi:hypothetical protein